MINLPRLLIVVFLVLLGGCGGGGGGSTTGTATQPPVTPPVIPPVESRLTKIILKSDAGDAIGLGQNYTYSLSDAKISVSSDHNRLLVQVEGDESWIGAFQTGGSTQNQLQAGTVTNVQQYVDGMDWGESGMTWWGEGRRCSSSHGWFSIDHVKYIGTQLGEVKIRFERQCDGAAAAMHGEITYYADDTTKPPPPVAPVPASLWRPPGDVANSVGNYAYFESDDGDYVGLGKTWRYDQRSSKIDIVGDNVNLNITVNGSDLWSAELRGMYGFKIFQPGYYPGIHGSRFHNPVKGGMSLTGAGRGCSKSTGWVVIDSVTSDATTLRVTAIDLRFEQHCEGRAAALRGVIHWKAPSPLPPVAVNTEVGSWYAPATALPVGGNYLYMQSDVGEPLAKGLIDLQTNSTATFSVDVQDNRLAINVHGAHHWNVSLAPKPGQSQFTVGDYGNLTRGAFTVSLDGYGEFSPQGWVVIDSINYSSGKIVALDLRFEELGNNRAGNASGLLHGQLHWRAGQSDNFTGPSMSVPSLFWHPEAGNTPSSGNYIYLESDRSDYLGDESSSQSSHLYTPLNSLITVSGTGNSVSVEVKGDKIWGGSFAAMSNATQILTGYYAGLNNSAAYNPSRGKFNWSGNARGCNEATSGVVVDKVTYSGNQLIELLMRFEQHCDNDPGPTRGEIRWMAADMRQPSGPAPIPADLWRAPAGSLPTSGNYLYVQSDQGDRIGQGRSVLMTNKDTQFFASLTALYNNDAYFGLSMESSKTGLRIWSGAFQTMIGMKKFQTGFYDYVMRIPFQNRAFGGLSWSANGVGCNNSIGWFAVDKAVYVGETLTHFHARFEQHCEYLTPSLRGELNWEGPALTTALRKQSSNDEASARKMRTLIDRK
ncbi:hypothetical protein KDM87_16725 [Undibacterium sp. FT147W]|uniref:Uncharacterized protein n=1 Tax=Undibacterium rivi TaxID=2828729 RepID=A0ABS5H5X4_9BURK|nr:hypothetical protein [Undibacterium rivi]MBR7794242.1 hypothetical protein [Undibacterium rivi]